VSKVIQDNAPEYMNTWFTFTSEIHVIYLRKSSCVQLDTPQPNNDFFSAVKREYMCLCVRDTCVEMHCVLK